MALASNNGTSNPLLKGFLVAQRINKFVGGAVIAPWEIDELSEDWLDAAYGLAVELPDMRGGMAEVETYMQKWRAEHRKNG